MARRRSAPPRFFQALLDLVLPEDVVGRSIRGDLAEEFRARTLSQGAAARRWYRREVLGVAVRLALSSALSNGPRVHARARLQGRERREGDPMWQVLWRDVRYSVRALGRAPRFTLIATLTLALGIGANTAIFSAVNGVLLRPLAFPESDRLVGLWHGAPELGYDQFGISTGIYQQYLSENQVYEGMAMFTSFQANLTEDGDAERVPASATTHGLFDVLGVSPLMGRTYSAEEDTPDGPSVVVLSHDLWQTRYGGRHDVLGQTVRVNGEPSEIIGVMPADFDFGGTTGSVRLWKPLAADLADPDPGGFSYSAVARLRPGVTEAAAEAQMSALVARVKERWADAGDFINFLEAGGFHPIVHTLREEIVGELERPLWILLGTVGFVLLIACANVANLFLVRAEGKQREMAVRTAMGATRGTLVRQFLTESAILAAAGGAVGLAVAWASTPALVRMAPPELPRLDEISIDGTVLAFTGGATALAALLFGAAPALRYNLTGLLGMLRYAGRGTTQGRERHRVRTFLVVGQTSLAMILLVGSGLLLRSFQEIRSRDAGFDTEGVLTFGVALSPAEYASPHDVAGFHQQLLERLRALPGVEKAGGISSLPLASGATGTAHDIEDFPTGPDELPPIFWYKFATPDYFEALGISVVAGRGFERADHERSFGNVLVSQPLADRIWPEQSVLGKRIRFAGDTTAGWQTIVGVAEAVRDRGLREEPSEIVYRPMVAGPGDDGWSVRALTYVLRSDNPGQLAAGARQAVRELNANLPVASMRTMTQVVSDSVVRLSFTTLALAIAALMALVLGAIGLYGVLSYVVSQRTQEIGVRMAMGARREQVQSMVVASGAKLAALGLILGLAGAAGLTRLLQGLLYGTRPLDPLTFVGMSVVLLAVGLVASYLPARRAAAVNPVESMRAE